MNEMNEKYLARMLEGAENGIQQVDMAIDQLEKQREEMVAQREDMVTAVDEIRGLLGLEGEGDLDEVTEMVEGLDDASETSEEESSEEG